jgi:hypothetical protein
MFIAVIVVGYLAYRDGQQIKNQTQTIKNNQYSNSVTLETFVREGLVCTFTIVPNPTASKALITQEVDNCFKNTPEVK